MREDNQIIHSLWIGTQLQNIELLTLSSFISKGHTFYLWVYDDIETPLPNGVKLKNANEILSKEKIFKYLHTNKNGHGKGSVAGFSDIFRCKLLYEKGGWWVDMDVTCFKPFDFDSPYVFRKDKARSIVNNLIKCPPRSAIMKWCYEQTLFSIDENNTQWMLPSILLKDGIQKFGLESYISSSIANVDRWDQIELYLNDNQPIPNNQYVIHWMNEGWKLMQYNKQKAVQGALYSELLRKYNLDFEPITAQASFSKKIYWSLKIAILKNIPTEVLEWYFNK